MGRSGATPDALILIAVFLLALFPYAVSFVLMYPDENDYLDGGVFMCQSHDYLMPAWPNDAPPDFIKPILTYWIVVVSYKLFGFSLAAARLPFLLAGAVVIWLTHRLALMLTASATHRDGSRAGATFSCVVLLCNPLFWLCALRCLPDIWLCLFLLVSTYGFLGLLTRDAPSSVNALLAYAGFGLAVLAKGVPAVIFLAYALAFGCCNPWRPGTWRRLVHVPSMVLGVALAVSWFVAVYFTHGTENLKGLWTDQVAGRVNRAPGSVIYRFPLAFGVLLLTCLPWLWPLCRMGRRWRSILPASTQARMGYGFIVPWILLTLLMTSATANFSIRYVLPVLPLLAVGVGLALARVDGEILGPCCRRLLAVALGLQIAVVLVSLVLGVQLGLTGVEWGAGLLLAVVSVLACAMPFRGSWLLSARGIAVACLLIMPTVYLVASRFVRTELEQQIAGHLEFDPSEARPVAGFVGGTGPASRLRVALAPRVKLMQWLALPSAPAGLHPAGQELPGVLILPEQAVSSLGPHRYALHAAGSLFASPSGDELVRAISAGRLKECLSQHRLHYTIAVRVDSTDERNAQAREVGKRDLASHPLLQRE
jgi:4-amino-4-deoxy-L-arabinose transferase-like glycosyltransferase